MRKKKPKIKSTKDIKTRLPIGKTGTIKFKNKKREANLNPVSRGNKYKNKDL